MNVRALPMSRQLGLAASTALALGLLGFAPAAVAHADSTAAATASVENNTLVVDGTDGNDTVQIRSTVDPHTFSVDLGDGSAAQTFDASTFGAIVVDLGDGNDTFSVSAGGPFSDKPLFVDGGAGDDTINGSDGNDTILGGPGNDTIDGGRGADTELLGPGRDDALWLPGEGSDVIHGGSGHDTLDFVGSAGNEHFAVFANGSHAVLTRDLGSITMDTRGVDELSLATLAGTDTVTVGDTTGTDLDETNIDLSSLGAADGQLDTVVLNGTAAADHVHVKAEHDAVVEAKGLGADTEISGADATDVLQVNGADGNDRVDVDTAAHALMTIGVDLGAGQL